MDDIRINAFQLNTFKMKKSYYYTIRGFDFKEVKIFRIDGDVPRIIGTLEFDELPDNEIELVVIDYLKEEGIKNPIVQKLN